MTDKPLLRVLAGERQVPPPFWLMRQAGRYLPEYRELRSRARDFLDFCFTPELATEATMQPIRRFGMDAAILFSDILVVPHALGQKVWFEEGAGPRLEPLENGASLAKLDPAALRERLTPVYQTVRTVRAALDQENNHKTALIGFAGAPWTVASYMVEGGSSRDFPRIKAWAYRDADSFQLLIDILVESTIMHLMSQIDAGAEAVQLFDTWAGVLPAPQFERWCLEPARRVVAGLRAKRPDIPIIGFPRGVGLLYRPYAKQTGVDAVSLDTAMPLDWARQNLRPVCALQGNLDPQMLVVGGAALEREARRILDGLAGGPHIFNLGHGVVPPTPPENVAALATLIRGYG